jgi:protease-4
MILFLKRIWNALNFTRKLFLNIIFISLFAMMFMLFSHSEKIESIDQNTALILSLNGEVVEQLTYVEPIEKLMDEANDENDISETLLSDLIKAIKNAKTDPRITTLVISTQNLQHIGLTKIHDLDIAIKDFKISGKPVIAYADYFSQSQLLISAQADEVIMNPQGGVFLIGLSQVGTYFKDFLDKWGINVHVFKVGKFKSAVEPFVRNSMSDEAKEANRLWMGDLWDSFKTSLAHHRKITVSDIDHYIENYKNALIQNKANTGKMALDAKLVDRLASRIEFREFMIKKTGLNESTHSYRQISHRKYLKTIRSPITLPPKKSEPKIAIIRLKGTIIDGEAKEGTIGGDTVARLIRKTRYNSDVKAIVLRVDSGGGSAFASEIIREELVKAQKSGIKVVASMGDVAASGGYWISASSDEIWAMPTTITGSIGIFGLFPTFEKPLNDLGIYRDGVGTTPYANAIDIGMPLSKDMENIIQIGIEAGYQRFIKLVADSRKMTLKAVDKIAQGRVWSGKKAKTLGLVDHLGGLNEAIASAAKLAKLKNYSTFVVKRTLSENERLLRTLLNQSSIQSFFQENAKTFSATPLERQLLAPLKKGISFIKDWNDPNYIYAHCFCELK